MIGVFDSGHGGLTIFSALTARFGDHDWVYLGDHANAPYGNQTGEEIVDLTKAAVNHLFAQGCRLVIIGCNTATAIAGRTLQQEWLHHAWPGHRLLGIIAPTVEGVTQTPWHENQPVFPQKYNRDVIALFATAATVQSGVYDTEIAKRCPRVRLAKQACPRLVALIESGAPQEELRHWVNEYVQNLLACAPETPHSAILGCTHYPLVADLFRAALPPQTRVFDQPEMVADALEDYFGRHGEVTDRGSGKVRYLTTGDPTKVADVAARFLGARVAWKPAVV